MVVVNQADEEIGLKSYADITHDDIYRVSALWLSDFNTGDCLLTQRKWAKHIDPGKWMAAASGTIEEGESYDENIVHEVEEEIGLNNLELKKGPKEYNDDGQHRYFTQWYRAEVDKEKIDIKIQEDEVEDYAWVSKQQLIEDVATNPHKFVPSMLNALKILGIA